MIVSINDSDIVGKPTKQNLDFFYINLCYEQLKVGKGV